MRMPVRPLRCSLAFLCGVEVELHRQPLGDKMLFGKAAHRFEPVLAADPGIGRRGHDDLARDLRVPARLGPLGGVPQHRRRANRAAAPAGGSTSWCSGTALPPPRHEMYRARANWIAMP